MTDLLNEPEPVSTTTLDLRREQRRMRRAKRRRNTIYAVAIALIVFAAGGSVAWNVIQSFRGDPDVIADYEGAGHGDVQIVIEPGDTGAVIAETLFEAGVVASPESFVIAWNANAESQRIAPGHYFLRREMKAEFALLALLDPNNRNELVISVPEGQRLEQYFERIANITGYSVEEVEAAAANTEALGLPAEANGNLEGWLFPSTYRFNPGVHPTEVLSEMVALTVRVLDDRGVAPEDRNRILTIASIIEREALLEEDRPMISGVIHNRLDINMPLEMDSTVKYISPSEGVFTTEDERSIESPYNTYRVVGLPPGPIAGAGISSIEAAMGPVDHNYLFFVTVNISTGETLYAEVYADHLRNVEIMQQWFRDQADEDS